MRFNDIQKKREEEISMVDLGIGHLVKERVQELVTRINRTAEHPITKVTADRTGVTIESKLTAGNEYWEKATMQGDGYSPEVEELVEILDWKYIENPDFDWSEVRFNG